MGWGSIWVQRQIPRKRSGGRSREGAAIHLWGGITAVPQKRAGTAAQAGGSALGLVGWDGSAGGKGDDFYLGTKQEINSVATEGHLSHGPNPPTHFLKAKTRTTPTCPPTRHIGWGGGNGSNHPPTQNQKPTPIPNGAEERIGLGRRKLV